MSKTTVDSARCWRLWYNGALVGRSRRRRRSRRRKKKVNSLVCGGLTRRLGTWSRIRRRGSSIGEFVKITCLVSARRGWTLRFLHTSFMYNNTLVLKSGGIYNVCMYMRF